MTILTLTFGVISDSVPKWFVLFFSPFHCHVKAYTCVVLFFYILFFPYFLACPFNLIFIY